MCEWTHGRHTVVAGAAMAFWQSVGVQSPACPAGIFSFSGQYSSLRGDLPAPRVWPVADLAFGFRSYRARPSASST
jgi:hypothetical protein